MPIVPDTKDWTWVLDRPCPECGFVASAFDLAGLPGMIRANAAAWQDLLSAPSGLDRRPSPDRWSPLEYACHVRDVFRLYDVRLHLMLDEDDPAFANWDQDATAVEDSYNTQSPPVVAGELTAAAGALADSFASVAAAGDQWTRTGTRSDGAHFTVESFARYLIHDPVHHLYDVASMPGVSLAPARDIERVAAAERRLAETVAGLTDDMVRRPSLLPSWTIGHLLSHLARNADSHVRRSRAAIKGRASAIEAGAGRSAAEVLADLRNSTAAMQAAWRDVPNSGWLVESPDVGGRSRAMRGLPARRWQELEVHLVDLGLGPTHRDWSDDFVAAKLPELRRTLAARLPAGEPAPRPGSLDERDELAWLYGRWRSPDLPELAPWG